MNYLNEVLIKDTLENTLKFLKNYPVIDRCFEQSLVDFVEQ